MSSLAIINFNNNKIKVLGKSVFIGLSILTRIYFDSNKIEVIDSHKFNGLSSLRTIEFSFNQIKEKIPCSFDAFKIIKLFNNNF